MAPFRPSRRSITARSSASGRVVVDEEGERRLDLPEGLRRLRHDAERDGAGEEARAGHQIGEDDGDLGVARLVEGELQAGVEHAPAVHEHRLVARHQVLLLGRLAVVERDAFGVLAHAHQGEAEIGLERLLGEVERDQPAADHVGEPGAEEGVDQRHPDHVARDVSVDADGSRATARPRAATG